MQPQGRCLSVFQGARLFFFFFCYWKLHKLSRRCKFTFKALASKSGFNFKGLSYFIMYQNWYIHDNMVKKKNKNKEKLGIKSKGDS